jgi:hypothetical protein
MAGRVVQAPARSTRAILTFFVLTFGWTWGFLRLSALIKPQASGLSSALSLAPAFGPGLAAAVVTLSFVGDTGCWGLSVAFARLSVNTGFSVLPAILLHSLINWGSMAVPVMPKVGDAQAYSLVAGIAILVALVAYLKPDQRRCRHADSLSPSGHHTDHPHCLAGVRSAAQRMTLTGWVALFGGLWRMAAPHAQQATDDVLTYAVLAAIAAIGAILSVMAYGPKLFRHKSPLMSDNSQTKRARRLKSGRSALSAALIHRRDLGFVARHSVLRDGPQHRLDHLAMPRRHRAAGHHHLAV